jgi:hypothetical protein
MQVGESIITDVDWEAMWSPYDEATYQAVLDQIDQDDIVLDIGAGDLRLARRMATRCRYVYAIEIQEEILNHFEKESAQPIPGNLLIMHADARYTPFTDDVTTGVLLMRHCTNFRLYADKLKMAGAERLITNGRWRLGVEVIPLQATRLKYQQLSIGWYACWCGTTGFKCGPFELFTPEVEDVISEVTNCPHCETMCK